MPYLEFFCTKVGGFEIAYLRVPIVLHPVCLNPSRLYLWPPTRDVGGLRVPPEMFEVLSCV